MEIFQRPFLRQREGIRGRPGAEGGLRAGEFGSQICEGIVSKTDPADVDRKAERIVPKIKLLEPIPK